MTSTVPGSASAAWPPGPPNAAPVVRVTEPLRLSAARRLVSARGDDGEAAALRLLDAGPGYGIDFSLCWATVSPSGDSVRQACLAVPGAGRTAMLFLSEPDPGGEPGGSEGALADRSALVRAACVDLAREWGGAIALVQALPDAREAWAIAACEGGGLRRIAELRYLRRAFGRAEGAGGEFSPPEGVEVTPASAIPAGAARDAALLEALERSYVGTLDCPELCGLRALPDILASHRAVGVHDPSLWWIVGRGGSPRGCMLLSRCPEQRAVELVYLGLAPELRGRGLGAGLLAMGLSRGRGAGMDAMLCAVDARNAPAVSLYARLGFRTFASRVALVRAL